MTAHGYPNTYNVSGGFEGDLDGSATAGLRMAGKQRGCPGIKIEAEELRNCRVAAKNITQNAVRGFGLKLGITTQQESKAAFLKHIRAKPKQEIGGNAKTIMAMSQTGGKCMTLTGKIGRSITTATGKCAALETIHE